MVAVEPAALSGWCKQLSVIQEFLHLAFAAAAATSAGPKVAAAMTSAALRTACFEAGLSQLEAHSPEVLDRLHCIAPVLQADLDGTTVPHVVKLRRNVAAHLPVEPGGPPVVALTAAQLRSSQRGARKPKQQAIGQTVDLPSQGRLCTTPAAPCIVVGDGRHSVVHSDASSELDTASIAVSAIGDSGAYDCLLSMTSGECTAIPEVPGTRCSPIGVQTSKPRRASRAVQTDAADFCSLGTVQDGGVITHNMKDALTALGCAQDAVDSTASELKALTGELDLARQALARHSVAAAEAHTRMVSGPFGQLSPELVVERMSVLVELCNTLRQSASLRLSLLELEAQAKLNHEAH